MHDTQKMTNNDMVEEPPEVLMARILKKKQRKLILYTFASMGKLHRQYLIRNGNYFIFGKYISALLEIQRVFRGYLVRKKRNILPLRKRQSKISSTTVAISEPLPLVQLVQQGVIPLDIVLKNIVRRKLCEKENGYLLILFQSSLYNSAALLIQQKYKLHRSNLKKIVGEGKFYQRGRVHFFDTMHEAAYKIQRAFSGYKNRRIFDFYRLFVRSKELQNPTIALKFINPKETALVEKGSHVAIKFRLSGPHFPPLIVYKIFLTSSLCDVNAFAPRDYTAHKQTLPTHLFNTTTLKKNNHQSNPHQYQRFENNNWRSIFHTFLPRVNHIVLNQQTIPITSFISNEEVSKILTRNLFQPKYHYSTEQRKQHYAKKRKKRQLDWMLKSIRETSHKVEELPLNSVRNILQQSTTLESIDYKDIFTEDEQANAIIDWANKFDFENYLKTWAMVGSSHFS